MIFRRLLFILAGALGRWFTRPLRWPALLASALIGWHVGESAWIAPHYLAYFNELAGGPRGGWRRGGRHFSSLTHDRG